MATRQERREKQRAVWAETPWEDVAAYIGPNAGQFRKVWEKQRQVMLEKGYGNTWSFSWPALVLSYVWFLYRKQWAVGAVLVGLPIIIGLLFPNALGGFGGVGIVIAMLAKGLYLQVAVPKIAKMRALAPDDAARHAVLAAAGGVSWPAAIVSGVFFAATVAAVIISATRN
jgi:hypothetical protein